MFKLEDYKQGRTLFTCPRCGQDENVARVVEAHPWQRLGGPDQDGNYTILAEGDDLELRCECGAIYWVPGRAYGPALETKE